MKKRFEIYTGGELLVHSHEINETDTVEAVLRQLTAAGRLGGHKAEEVHLFEEDADDELPREKGLPASVRRLHAHRCRHIKVKFIHVDTTAEHAFTPAATIRKLIRWAKAHFKIDAKADYDLRLGSAEAEPLPLDAHIGSYASSPDCSVTLYFGPTRRIEG